MESDRPDDLLAWDSVSESYVQQPQIDWFDDFLDRHLADVAGKRVLDLGCGHGWYSGQLHDRGAHVTGVDGSERLLDMARSEHPHVAFEQRDLRHDFNADFDVIVALMVLMDLPDLSKLRLRVRPGGVFVATILHPAFFMQQTVDEDDGSGYRKVRNYLDEEAWWLEAFGGHWHYHRPLGAYVSWLASCGLGLVELCEPAPRVYDGWRRKIPTRVGLAARPFS